jgi:hypothetical protein
VVPAGEAVAPRITFGQRARLAAGTANDEDHEIVIVDALEQARAAWTSSRDGRRLRRDLLRLLAELED